MRSYFLRLNKCCPDSVGKAVYLGLSCEVIGIKEVCLGNVCLDEVGYDDLSLVHLEKVSGSEDVKNVLEIELDSDAGGEVGQQHLPGFLCHHLRADLGSKS